MSACAACIDLQSSLSCPAYGLQGGDVIWAVLSTLVGAVQIGAQVCEQHCRLYGSTHVCMLHDSGGVPWAHPSLGLAGEEQEDEPEEDARETTSTSPGRAESIMAMRWRCDSRSSRLTTLPTALRSLSARIKQLSDTCAPSVIRCHTQRSSLRKSDICCPRPQLSEDSGSHCCYLSGPCNAHCLACCALCGDRRQGLFCAVDGVPKGLEALQARHMREGAEEGRG